MAISHIRGCRLPDLQKLYDERGSNTEQLDLSKRGTNFQLHWALIKDDEKKLIQGTTATRDVQSQPDPVLARLQYMKMSLKELEDLCTARGINRDGLPKRGENNWLAWKLAQYDEGA